MQKISSSTATANSAGEFSTGSPGTGVGATLITAAWLTAVQRELVNVIVGGGLEVTPSDDSQLLKAIQALLTLSTTWAKLGGKPTTVSGFGITDAYTKSEVAAAIQAAVSNLVASSPAALDTLKELADALGNDPNFATTMTNALANKANKATTLAGYNVSFADQAEAEAGTDNTKPMSALRVWQAIAKVASQATEAVLGFAKIGTQAQVNAGTDDATIVTPKKMRAGFSISLATNGWIAFPTWMGGLIFQWGYYSGSLDDLTALVTFPVAFPSSNLCLSVTGDGPQSSAGYFVTGGAVKVSTQQFRLNGYGNTIPTTGYHWFAIGY